MEKKINWGYVLFIFFIFLWMLIPNPFFPRGILKTFKNGMMPQKEGLVNMDGSGNPPPGLGANASEYNTALSNYAGKMNDSFLISKYKKEYENVILNLENISNYMMLQTTLSIKTSPNISVEDLLAQFKILNELKQSQDSLNVVMKFIDSQ